MLESGLRLFNYGYPSEFFVKQKIGDQEFYVNNYKFSWRFFPKSMARLSASVVVPVEKDKDVFRIFVVGESAAMGDPEPSFSVSRMLGVMLEKKYPDKKIEIYNTAVTAINSNVILPIVHDCLKLEPDLFVVYMGNNEVIGPYGLSAALSPFFSNQNVIKTQVFISDTKIGQLMRSLSGKKESEQQEWKGMEMFIQNKIRHNNPDLEKIYSHYEDNLNAICAAASSVGAKVVLTTIITNERDCAPFVSLHQENFDLVKKTNWEMLYKKGIESESAGQFQHALQFYEQARVIDTEYAELNFRIGKCLLSLDQPDKAKAYFIQARDYDALRFRADSRLNLILKRTAQEWSGKGIYLADAAEDVRTRSTMEIPGNEFLYEHVHLNPAGNHLLANSILKQVEKAFGFNTTIELQDVEECKRRLSYTLFDEKRINEINLSRLRTAPFINQLSNPTEIADLEKSIQQIEQALDSSLLRSIHANYQHSIEVNPNDWFIHLNYLRFLYAFNYNIEAEHEAEMLYRLLPYEYLSSVNMGITKRSLKEYKKAKEYFERAVRVNPYFSEAFRHLASLYEEEGRFYQAASYYERGRVSSGELAFFYNRAGVEFVKINSVDSAITYFNKAIQLKPDFIVVSRNLNRALLMKEQKVVGADDLEFKEVYDKANSFLGKERYPEAIVYYQKALRIIPSYAKSHNNIGIAFIRLGRYKEAIHHLSKAIEIDPNFFEAYPNLGIVLNQQGQYNETIVVLEKILPVHNDTEICRILSEAYFSSGDTVTGNKYLKKIQTPLKSGLKN